MRPLGLDRSAEAITRGLGLMLARRAHGVRCAPLVPCVRRARARHPMRPLRAGRLGRPLRLPFCCVESSVEPCPSHFGVNHLHRKMLGLGRWAGSLQTVQNGCSTQNKTERPKPPHTLGTTYSTIETTHRTPGTTPSTLGTTPNTLGTTHRTLGSTPGTLGSTPSTLETTPSTLGSTPSTLETTPSTLGTTPLVP